MKQGYFDSFIEIFVISMIFLTIINIVIYFIFNKKNEIKRRKIFQIGAAIIAGIGSIFGIFLIISIFISMFK